MGELYLPEVLLHDQYIFHEVYNQLGYMDIVFSRIIIYMRI